MNYLTPTRFRTALASVPALLYCRDQLYGLCRVEGSSMEPSLRNGDVLLVRKFEAASWLRGSILSGTEQDDERAREVAKVERYERMQGIFTGGGRLISSLVVVPGQVIVYQNPTSLKKELYVKRVVGVGGQWIRQEYRNRRRSAAAKKSNKTRIYDYRLELLPPYTVYVEGDNKNNSVDSRELGPLSKNLVVGVAEYVIWPPTRWKRMPLNVELDDDGEPRSLWS